MNRALIFLSAIIVFTLPLQAKKRDVTCPKELPGIHFASLKEHRPIQMEGMTFVLHGDSKKHFTDKTPETDAAPFVYSNTDGHKMICWYQTPDGYVGLMQQ
ncbi:MAG: hypothetical protein ACK5TR_05995 [Alphaproteobacteria bacterium]|jgi:hypothetical protein|nr:hypothetical protein [Alphaproteobacteria bacterium]